MTAETVLLHYQQKLQGLQSSLETLSSRQTVVAILGTAAVTLFLVLGFLALVRRTLPLWYSPLPLPLAVLCVRRYGRQQTQRATLARLREFYERGINRLQDRWAGEGNSGQEYLQPGHLYAQDLNLFGTGSLFERLCTARTEIGKRKLAGYLQDPSPSIEESKDRQAAVQELRERTELREQIGTLGETYQQSESATFTDWLARPITKFPPWLRALAALTSLIAATAILLAIPGVIPKSIMFATIGIQAAIAWTLRLRVAPILQDCRIVHVELGLLREGLNLLREQKFDSPKLQSLVNTVQDQNLGILAWNLRLLSERTKEHFYGPASAILMGSQCAMAIEAWRGKHGHTMQTWLDAWAEFEALNALACYAHECPEDIFPELTTGQARFRAEGLAHPLLPLKTGVRNDINLPRLLLISGSNMAGKSTLMRAIGVNAVLAAAGAPVRARSMQSSRFSLCASLSMQDALTEGKSKFLAEVERLRASIQTAAAHPPALFLIDEIFSGTNSQDRRIAAEAVINELLKHGAIGAVSTHDLALTEIPGATNVHMRSRPGADPLDFDYLLKPGVNNETNALAIARLAGVPV